MASERAVLVWDLPVRLGHWLMALSFLVAWVTAESETWRLVHVYAGAAVFAIALFRLIWGFIGSRHARFVAFVAAPGRAWDYVKSLLSGRPEHSVGHNPAGGYAILGLLALALASGATGWLAYQDLAGEWLKELHEFLSNAMLALVALHLAGVAVGSLAHRENLVRAMFTGRKAGAPEEAILSARPLAATILILWTVLAGFWLAR